MNLKDPLVFFSALTILNICTYLLNILISKIWNRLNGYKEVITKKEVQTSIFVVCLNIAIAIPGFALWKKDFITFADNSVIISFIALFLLIDFLMYFVHWLSHTIGFLNKIHAKHHEHSEKFNSVSLYYMSPWETILFGVLLTVVVFVFSFNLYGFVLFLTFNWIYGVISHLNTKSDKLNYFLFTSSMLHKKHHQLYVKNYGFYTFLWDKLFNTSYKKNGND